MCRLKLSQVDQHYRMHISVLSQIQDSILSDNFTFEALYADMKVLGFWEFKVY